MDVKFITMIVGLTGILATLISSSIGHYFTAKARASGFRQVLYNKQLDLIVDFFHIHGRFKIFAVLFIEEHHLEDAEPDMRRCVKSHSELLETASAILPVEQYVILKQLGEMMTNFLIKFDEDEELIQDDLIEFTALELKFALLSRSLLGVDELTTENVGLISTKKSYKRLIHLKDDYLKKITREKMN